MDEVKHKVKINFVEWKFEGFAFLP